MSFLMDYSSEFEKSSDLIQRKFALNCESAYTEFVMNSIDLFQEAENQKSGGFIGFLQKIITYVKNLISDIGEMIHNIFHPKDNAELENFLKTDRGKFNPGCDLQQVSNNASAKVKEGSKLIRLIANGTNVPEEQINRYLSTGAKAVGAVAVPTVMTALAYNMLEKYHKQQKENCDQVMSDAEAAEAVKDESKQNVITKIMNVMTKTISETTGAANIFQNNMMRYANMQTKNNKKQGGQ